MMLVIGEHPVSPRRLLGYINVTQHQRLPNFCKAAGHARVPKHHSLNLNTFKCDDSKVEARVDLDALRVGKVIDSFTAQ